MVTAEANSAVVKAAGVPFTLHLYQSGGHGYGLRKIADPRDARPEDAIRWFRRKKWIP
jgi:hypothetical protein